MPVGGTLYGIGVGPGDVRYITLARRTGGRVDVLAYLPSAACRHAYTVAPGWRATEGASNIP